MPPLICNRPFPIWNEFEANPFSRTTWSSWKSACRQLAVSSCGKDTKSVYCPRCCNHAKPCHAHLVDMDLSGPALLGCVGGVVQAAGGGTLCRAEPGALDDRLPAPRRPASGCRWER